MPAAAWAAKAGDPVLWSDRDRVPAATKAAITAHRRPRIYVLGPSSVISDKVLKDLGELGTTRRISGPEPVANAIAFARFTDGRFGWNAVDPGHGLVFATTKRPADAPASAALSGAGTYGPLLLVTEPNALPAAVQDYLLDIQPGYDDDPVRGVYNHGWVIGDDAAISIDVQSRIDALLEIQPVQPGSARKIPRMAQAEQPERLTREVTVDDVRQLMGASTPHFALQLRDRIRTLIRGLPPEDPARLLGEQEIARLERLGFEGELRGEPAQDGQRSLPSLGDDEQPHYVEGPTSG